ncbi:MAG: hypothetical protein R3C05_11730 [Pirellulaceae bacterium]
MIERYALTLNQSVVLNYIADLPVDTFVQPVVAEQTPEPLLTLFRVHRGDAVGFAERYLAGMFGVARRPHAVRR